MALTIQGGEQMLGWLLDYNDNDEVSSVISDFSDDFELLTNNNKNVEYNVNANLNQPRRGIRELKNLGDVQRLPRLRSGRN